MVNNPEDKKDCDTLSNVTIKMNKNPKQIWDIKTGHGIIFTWLWFCTFLKYHFPIADPSKNF